MPCRSKLDPVIEAILIALLIFLPATFGGVDAVHEFLACAAAALLALLLSIRAVVHPSRFTSPSIWIVPVLFIVIALIQLIPLPAATVEALSPDTAGLKRDLLDDLPDAKQALARMTLSFYSLATRDDLRLVLLAATVLWTVVVIYRDTRSIRRLLWAITLIGAATALLAIAQDITRTDSIYWTVFINEPARFGPFVNHSQYSQFMNLSIAAALALLLTRLNEVQSRDSSPLLHWAGTLIPAGVIVLGLATIMLSLSRGGMISVAGAGVFILIVLLTIRRLRWLAGVIALLGVISIVALSIYGIEHVQERLRQRGGLETRVQILRDSWDLSRKFPLTGVGLGTFEWVYTMHDRTGTPNVASHAENEYIHVLVETGWLGALLVGAMIGIVAWHWWRGMRSDDAFTTAAAAGIAYGIVAVMIHSLSDFSQHLPSNAALSATLCGVLISLGARRRDTEGAEIRWRIPAVAIGIIACAIFAWLLIDAFRSWRAERHWQAAQVHARRLGNNDWEGTRDEYAPLIEHAQAAIDAQPDSAYYRYWTALYRWRQSRRTRADDDPQLLPEAQQVVAELHEARRLCPTWGMIYSVLGQIEHAYLELPIGITHIQTAARLEPNDSGILIVAGRSDARREKLDSAIDKFARAVRLDETELQEVLDFCIDELEQPELALRVAEATGNYMRLVEVNIALQKHPEHQAIAAAALKRGADLMEQQIDEDASGFELASLASYRFQLEDYASAEKYFARALQHEPSNLWWRLTRAQALHKLGRSADAIAEAQRALRDHPGSTDAQRILNEVSATPR